MTSSADTVSVVTTGVAFQEKCDVPMCVIMMTIFMMDIMMRTQIYFDYDDPGDFDSYPDVYGFIEPDDYELYHDLHGLDDCGVYCISRGEAGIAPYWTGVEIMRGMLSYPGPGPMSRSTVLFLLPGLMSRSTVLFVLPGRMNQ